APCRRLRGPSWPGSTMVKASSVLTSAAAIPPMRGRGSRGHQRWEALIVLARGPPVNPSSAHSVQVDREEPPRQESFAGALHCALSPCCYVDANQHASPTSSRKQTVSSLMNPRASGRAQPMETYLEPALCSKQSPTNRALVFVEA